jgi:glycosyltransferase involved in cell wall biosynthesis
MDIPTNLAQLSHTQDGLDYEVADWSKLPASPVLSVGIVTFQHAPYIRQTLDSVLMQQVDFPIEICVGEDGSTDGTREICLEYAAKHPNKIRLFLRDRNNPARNKYPAPFMHNGIQLRKACRGKYVALLDGDDYWTDPLKIQKQVAFLETHNDCALCFHRVPVFHGTEATPRYVIAPREVKLLYDFWELLGSFAIQTGSVVFRNGLVDQLPDWLYTLPMGDWPYLFLLSEKGNIGYIDEAMSVYRSHSQGTWAGTSDEQMYKRWKPVLSLFQRLRPPTRTQGKHVKGLLAPLAYSTAKNYFRARRRLQAIRWAVIALYSDPAGRRINRRKTVKLLRRSLLGQVGGQT